MAINDITLAGGMRGNLVNLQLISALQSRTTERLATGKRVNTAVDDPASYFAAASHRSRAGDLAARKDAMGEAIQAVKAASQGIDAITKLIEQAKGLTAAASSANATDRASLSVQFTELMAQVTNLANDAGYKGTNFLASGILAVNFNEDGSSSLTITGFDASSTGLAIAAPIGAWVLDASITTSATELDAALLSLRVNGKTLSSNSGVVTTRQEFTTNLINTLTTGADQLTAADTNEEGANMLALQTRQSLGVVALQLSNQAQQSILRLFQ
jgi:flagellin-like hook-associated protein FlgL